jgi:peptide deformylase
MKIITVPHSVLRSTSQIVDASSNDVKKFLSEIEYTLVNQRNPKGVGLAAPQLGQPKRIFATYLPEQDVADDDDKSPSVITLFINPIISKKSQELTFGGTEEQPTLEGCLSIPKLYGPVPRWQWIEIEYQTLKGDKIVEEKKRFDDFTARVVQHELDHLDGILFTDYSLKYDLPVYQEDPKTKKLVELETRNILEVF